MYALLFRNGKQTECKEENVRENLLKSEREREMEMRWENRHSKKERKIRREKE